MGGLFLYFSFLWRRPLWRGKRARCWMVRICAVDGKVVLCRPQHGFLDPVTLIVRCRQHRNRHQYRRHNSVDALSGHDAREDAPARMAEPDDGRAGDSAVIWMHFFWVFGHPEVYVLAIPAFAFASEIIPVFSRKAIFGYPVMVLATVAIGFISMSVWAHHIFTVGMTSGANTFFVLSTMAIAVPTGIKIFNWLATMWGGKIRFAAPMLFCIAFLFQFLIAGLTGVTMAVAPFDWQFSGSWAGSSSPFSEPSTTGGPRPQGRCITKRWPGCARCCKAEAICRRTGRI